MPPEITQEELDAFKAAQAERDAAKKELDALKASTPPTKKEPEDPSLQEKARLERERKEAEAGRTKLMESALRFDVNSEKFLKDNSALLPSEVSDIFKQAGKETYSDAIEKDQAIKSGMIQAFFSVQANVDLLTSGQKKELEDYLKLTKNGKQEKAQGVYDMIFEPAFETLKRVKKAEALSKGHGSGDDDSYKKKLMAGSRKHYLGESKNA